MENQLLKLITESKVEQSTALTLQNAFLPAYDQLIEWSEKAKTLVVTDGSQTREMKMAREARLALKDIRVSANKTRISLKEDSTRYGKAVQSVYNLIEGLITPAEKHLETQEKFVELQEEKRKKDLWSIRSSELLPYREFVTPDQFAELGEITEEEYQKLVEDCKQALENQIAEQAQAKLDRIEKERQKTERQNRLFEAGFKWDGRLFTQKGIKISTEVMDYSSESFDIVINGAKARIEQLNLEEQAAARAERFSQTTPIVEVSYNAEAKQKAKDNVTEVLKQMTPEDVVPVSPVVSTSYPAPASLKYNFHCFLCGAKLSQIGPSELECEDCLVMFIPYKDHSGNQCLASQK